MPEKPPPIPPRCVSVREAASLLGVCELTIHRLIKAGRLRASRAGSRVLIKISEIEKFLEANAITQ